MATVGRQIHVMKKLQYDEELEIKPPSGEEWFVPNIYHGGKVQIIKTNGAESVPFASDNELGAWVDFKFFVRSTDYLIIKGLEIKGVTVGFEGVRVS